MDTSSFGASSPDQEASRRQALLPDLQEQEVSFSTNDATPTGTSSATEESAASASDSASASQDSDDSEDATATPGAADSQSDESEEGDSEEGGAVVIDTATDMPVVVTAK